MSSHLSVPCVPEEPSSTSQNATAVSPPDGLQSSSISGPSPTSAPSAVSTPSSVFTSSSVSQSSVPKPSPFVSVSPDECTLDSATSVPQPSLISALISITRRQINLGYYSGSMSSVGYGGLFSPSFTAVSRTNQIQTPC